MEWFGSPELTNLCLILMVYLAKQCWGVRLRAHLHIASRLTGYWSTTASSLLPVVLIPVLFREIDFASQFIEPVDFLIVLALV